MYIFIANSARLNKTSAPYGYGHGHREQMAIIFIYTYYSYGVTRKIKKT